MRNSIQPRASRLPRLAVALVASALLAPVYGADAGQAKLTVDQSDTLGEYISDQEGRSLYMFEKDEPGSGKSTCYDACAEAWPPLLTEGEPKAGEGLDADKIGTIERTDGSMQVTYGDWPLYYFSPDKQPGDTKGQDVMGFGAEWYLVDPAGDKVSHEGS